jgi:hypothetical protein
VHARVVVFGYSCQNHRPHLATLPICTDLDAQVDALLVTQMLSHQQLHRPWLLLISCTGLE